LIGTLRSFDQFANLVLVDTIERVFVGSKFGDLPPSRTGQVLLIRGENVVLLGDLDLNKEDSLDQRLERVSAQEIKKLKEEEMEKNKKLFE